MYDEEKDILSENERALMRARLSNFMSEHPARAPFAVRALDSISAGWNGVAYLLQSTAFRFSAGAVALVFILGAGTSYAAEGALPGNPLYTIKTHVNEPIQGAFATTPEAKANWSADLASTRLSEAETLAARNRLTPGDAEDISSGLDQATENFDASVAALSSSSSTAAQVASLESDMQATLEAHGQVLAELASVIPQVKPVITPLIARVQTRALALGNATVATDTELDASSSVEVEVAALVQKSSDERGLHAARMSPIAASGASSTSDATGTIQSQVENSDASSGGGDSNTALRIHESETVNAQVARIRTDIANQLKDVTGLVLPSLVATSSDSSSLEGSSTEGSGVPTSTASSTPDGSHSFPHQDN